MGRNFKDETGNKYGKWTVLRRDSQQNTTGKVRWICQCQCGNIKSIGGDILRKGKSKSCGCWKTILKPGQKYNSLTLLEKTNRHDNFHHYYWKCQCDCGNIVQVLDKNFTSGNTKSCGCLNNNNNRLQLVGKTFGLLTVLEDAGNDKDGNSQWKCQCECGNITIVRGGNLKNGGTISCGCSKMSKGEIAIRNFLNDLHIQYKQEYMPKDLNGKRFDFAILNNQKQIIYLIEYDGIQHFQEWDRDANNDSLEKRQLRDKEKNQWAKKHKIPLVRIPYWELENINKDLIFGDKYLI